MKTPRTILFLAILSLGSIATQAQTKASGYNQPTLLVSSDDNESVLTWSTVKEVNSRYFIVESSTDNTHFTILKTIAAAGSSLFEKIYEFSGDAGMYYRVTLVDMNGERFTSPIVLTPTPGTRLAAK